MTDKSLHNSECFWCGTTYLLRQTEVNNIGNTADTPPRTCGSCRVAKINSLDPRINKFTYWSIKEINASWHEVKTDQIWDAALRSFAESLPIDSARQEQLIESLREKDE